MMQLGWVVTGSAIVYLVPPVIERVMRIPTLVGKAVHLLLLLHVRGCFDSLGRELLFDGVGRGKLLHTAS